MPKPNDIFEKLLAESPSFHGVEGRNQWSLAMDIMCWLFEAVQDGDHTLETGCGYSTLIFAMKGAHHTVISPVAEEHRRIVEWGEAHGVNFSRVTFLASKSEEVLPRWNGPLDLVLIDGWHAFPAPFIDWFFTCQKLAVRGRMIVDDTQIRACRILRDFLEEEKGRWELERRFERTDVFRKLKAEVFAGDWNSQPYGARSILNWRARYQMQIRPWLSRTIRAVPFLQHCVKKMRGAKR
jgi:predicted O-methyltransferase YrrM